MAFVGGNALAFYDFVTYSFFSIQIGHAFFPAASASSSLLKALAVFGAAFLMRPIGAVVFGRIADQRGRRFALVLSFGALGLALLGFALTPSFAIIGPAAPVLAIAFRLLQGFAIGGEVGPSTALMMEMAPLHQRGFYVSLLSAGSDLAVLAAGVAGFVLSHVLSSPTLDAWGWRLALLCGVGIIPIGLKYRLLLPELVDAKDDSLFPAASSGTRHTIMTSLLALMMLITGTTCLYGVDYLTTYAQATIGLQPSAAFTATIATGLVGTIATIVGGWLSDRFGRKPIVLIPFLILIIAVVPAFFMMQRFRTSLSICAVSALLACLTALPTAAGLTAIAENLPQSSRAQHLGVIYAIAVALFGGSTQFLFAWLAASKGAVAPAWWMTGMIVLGSIAMALFPVASPRRDPD